MTLELKLIVLLCIFIVARYVYAWAQLRKSDEVEVIKDDAPLDAFKATLGELSVIVMAETVEQAKEIFAAQHGEGEEPDTIERLEQEHNHG